MLAQAEERYETADSAPPLFGRRASGDISLIQYHSPDRMVCGRSQAIDEARLKELMADLESASVERTTSVTDTTKFSEAVCAFANDIVNSRSPGYLLIGVDDKSGKASGLQVTDQLLPNLAALGTDGNILPAPAVLTYKIALFDGSGEVAVVEVRPSDLPRSGTRDWYAFDGDHAKELPTSRKSVFLLSVVSRMR